MAAGGGFPVTRETSEADGGHILSEQWLNSTQGMEGEAERCHGSSFLGSVWSPGRHGTGCWGVTVGLRLALPTDRLLVGLQGIHLGIH